MEQGLLFLPGLFRTIWSSLLSSTPIKVWNPVTTVFFFFSLCAGRCGLSSVTLIIYLRLKRSEWFSDLMAVLQVVKGGDKGSWFPKEALKSCSISSWGLSKEIFISGAKVEKFNWILHSKCVYAAWWQPAKGTVRHFQSSLRSLAKKKTWALSSMAQKWWVLRWFPWIMDIPGCSQLSWRPAAVAVLMFAIFMHFPCR